MSQTFESIIDKLPIHLLLKIGEKVCSTDKAVLFYADKKHHKNSPYFKNREALRAAICNVWNYADDELGDTVCDMIYEYEETVTLSSGYVATIDDFRRLDNDLRVNFNPYTSSYLNPYTHQYEDKPDYYNHVTLKLVSESDLEEFPNECIVHDDMVDIIIYVDFIAIELPDFTKVFSSIEFGNHYDFHGTPINKEIMDADEDSGLNYEDGYIFVRIKKSEWDNAYAKAREPFNKWDWVDPELLYGRC
jgi:hypothetical protein